MIWGEKTTTQHAMDMELLEGCQRGLNGVGRAATYPQMPEMASTSRFRGSVGGAMVGRSPGETVVEIEEDMEQGSESSEDHGKPMHNNTGGRKKK